MDDEYILMKKNDIELIKLQLDKFRDILDKPMDLKLREFHFNLWNSYDKIKEVIYKLD